jgi:hypothetical protein
MIVTPLDELFATRFDDQRNVNRTCASMRRPQQYVWFKASLQVM